MSLSKQFETNKAKEVEGVALQYGENSDGTIPTFWLSRMSRANQQYTKTRIVTGKQIGRAHV